jgi:hypothetical protein
VLKKAIPETGWPFLAFTKNFRTIIPVLSIMHSLALTGTNLPLIFGINKTDIRHEKLFCWLFNELNGKV